MKRLQNYFELKFFEMKMELVSSISKAMASSMKKDFLERLFDTSRTPLKTGLWV
jgi:hypothetical protein